MSLDSFLAEFQQDDVYAAFLADSFHLQNAITLINNLPFNEQLAKISHGIDQVKQSINQLTSQNCEDFFQRTAKLDQLYEELRFISIKSQNLSKTLELMKSKLEVPYQQLFRQITLISRLQKTCDLLRKMLRILHLVKRIDENALDDAKSEQAIFLKEIVKVSQYVNEIDLIIASDHDRLLPKLNCIGKDLERFKQTKLELTEEAELLLKSGLSSADSNLIGTTCQVFHNLGLLEQTVDRLVAEKKQLLSQLASKSFTEFNYKSASHHHPQSGGNRASSAVRTSVRNSLKLLLDSVMSHFLQVSVTVKALKKRRDNVTQSLLIEFVNQGDSIVTDFWNELVKILSSAFGKVFNDSTVLKPLIESDYPKILPIVTDYWKRILHEEPAIESEKPLRSVISQFESAYLSNSLSLLFDSVNRIFSDLQAGSKSMVVSVPSEKDVDSIVKEIGNELATVASDSQLAAGVCRNVLKIVSLFMVKCEHLVSVDGHSTQVIGRFTTSQRHNALIVHILSHFSSQVRARLAEGAFSGEIRHSIEDSLRSVDTLIVNIIEPFINAIQDAIEDIICTMHNENYNSAGCVPHPLSSGIF